MINIINFALGQRLAVNEGEDINRANQLGLVAGLMGPSLIPAILVQQIAPADLCTAHDDEHGEPMKTAAAGLIWSREGRATELGFS